MAVRKKVMGAEPAHDGMNPLVAPQIRMAEALLQQQIDFLDFLKTRFESDRKMLGELAHSGDPYAAMSLWSEFWQNAATDYATESAKLSAAMQGVATAALSGLSEDDAVTAPHQHATPV